MNPRKSSKGLPSVYSTLSKFAISVRHPHTKQAAKEGEEGEGQRQREGDWQEETVPYISLSESESPMGDREGGSRASLPRKKSKKSEPALSPRRQERGEKLTKKKSRSGIFMTQDEGEIQFPIPVYVANH